MVLKYTFCSKWAGQMCSIEKPCSATIYPGGGGVLGISSDEDDRRIFLGLKFSIPGIFGELDLSRDFLGGFKKNR